MDTILAQTMEQIKGILTDMGNKWAAAENETCKYRGNDLR
jgi:hypothetical protein